MVKDWVPEIHRDVLLINLLGQFDDFAVVVERLLLIELAYH
jgi:hypothetical protein